METCLDLSSVPLTGTILWNDFDSLSPDEKEEVFSQILFTKSSQCLFHANGLSPNKDNIKDQRILAIDCPSSWLLSIGLDLDGIVYWRLVLIGLFEGKRTELY